MANTNRYNGMVPFRHLTGGCIRVSEYSIASAYNTNIFKGDVVELTGTGDNISKAAAENTNSIGVFAGVSYVDASGNQVFSKYWPADTVATEVKALVYNDPDISFEIEFDQLDEGDVGTLVDWNVGTGSTSTGLSGLYAVGTTGTSGKSLRILRLLPRVDNAYGAYGRAEVQFAEHSIANVVAGVGAV